MKKLPADFSYEKFGLKVSLVNEKDASFILHLRTNNKLSRHLHPTQDDLECQIQWIREYKIREKEGREYYFIFSKDDKPIGVNRVYNIFEYFGVGGSWLCDPNNDPMDSLITTILGDEVCFDIIGLAYIVFDVRKANTHVWKFHESRGAIKIGESDIDYYYYLSKTNYKSKINKYLRLLNKV